MEWHIWDRGYMKWMKTRIDGITLVDTQSPEDTKKLYQAHATREDEVRLLEKETSVRWTPNR